MGSGPRVGVWGRRWVEEGKAAGPGELESEAVPPLMGPVKVYRWRGECPGCLSAHPWVVRCAPSVTGC